MSIAKFIDKMSYNKFVIPCAGKMFRSNITSKDKALCFCINKGYFETNNLMSMLNILDYLNEQSDIFIIVGNVEKVILTKNKNIVYRQRLFFKNLEELFLLCKKYGLTIDFPSTFHISINSVLNCKDDLKYLERYASMHNETIDKWLTNCCLIHVNNYLKDLNINTSLDRRVERALINKRGYLDRAPFLISSYNIDLKSSSIYLRDLENDERLYSYNIDDKLSIIYGYTTSNIKKDKKEGVFDEDKKF